MEKFLLVLLILSGSAFVVQTILGLIGLSDDIDMPSEGEAAGQFGFITVRNMVTFVLGFSSAGYLVLRNTGSSFLSVIAGVIFGLILAGAIIFIFRMFANLEQKNEILPHEYRGIYATVLVKVDADRKSAGKVEFTLRERIDEMSAVTDEKEPLPKGEQVVITRLLDNGTLLVEKMKQL